MLVRKQIMMDDWIDEYLKKKAKKEGMSYARLVRTAVCFTFGDCNFTFLPDNLKREKFLSAMFFNARENMRREK